MPTEHSLSEADLSLIRAIITDAVRSRFDGAGERDQAIRARLRRYERTGVAIGLEPQTMQVIRSGRRLIGDRKPLRHRG